MMPWLGRPFDKSLMGTLESLAHRGYTEGFYAVMCMTNTRTMNAAARSPNSSSLSVS